MICAITPYKGQLAIGGFELIESGDLPTEPPFIAIEESKYTKITVLDSASANAKITLSLELYLHVKWLSWRTVAFLLLT